MKTITIGFISNRNPIAKFNQWLTKSNIDAVYIKFQRDNQPWIYCVDNNKIIVMHYDRFFRRTWKASEINFIISDEAWLSVEAFIDENIDNTLSFSELIGNYFVYLHRHLGVVVDNPFNKRPFLSLGVEMVAYALSIYDANTFTLSDLFHFLQDQLVEF
jgi:hypothetical protein